MPLIKHVKRDDHRCKPPNFQERIKYQIGKGSVWECPVCETKWILLGDDRWIKKPPELGAYGMQMKDMGNGV